MCASQPTHATDVISVCIYVCASSAHSYYLCVHTQVPHQPMRARTVIMCACARVCARACATPAHAYHGQLSESWFSPPTL